MRCGASPPLVPGTDAPPPCFWLLCLPSLPLSSPPPQIPDLYDPRTQWASYIINAIKAKELFIKDVNYIVKNNEVGARGAAGAVWTLWGRGAGAVWGPGVVVSCVSAEGRMQPGWSTRSSYTAHKRLHSNEWLAIKRLQLTDCEDCQGPLLLGL
jgi:hypothetical protein